jgi:mannosyltransferase
MRACAAVVALIAGSLLLRTGTMDAGYWIDEAISVGIASRDLVDIPWSLRLDGSPPLYYLLLHVWMGLVGTGEAATRTLSLIFAALAVPVAWWAARSVFDRRAALLAAVFAAACPFLTYYGQETRMYALVAVLSLLACASFVLAFMRGRRGHLVLLGLWLALLLYTHNWALFLVAGMAVAWMALWRSGRVGGRDGALVGVAVLVLYVPWIPSLASQVAHTGAPWSARPSVLWLAGALALVAFHPRDGTVRMLAAIAAAAAIVAWVCSQLEPAWAPRYLAVLFGPLLLALAAAASRDVRRMTAVAAAVAALALVTLPPPVKSNVRAVAAGVELRPGDLVVSTQPEQVPVLHRYLPAGVVYVTPLGVVPDPAVVDWRDALAQVRAGSAERRLLPLLDHVAPCRRVLLVTPSRKRLRREEPWTRAIRRRTREWRRALRADPRLYSLGRETTVPAGRSDVRAEMFEMTCRLRHDPGSWVHRSGMRRRLAA